jgi:HEPN domain-containing protein
LISIKTQNWIKTAKYDLRVASNAHKSGDYIACVEKCHNSIEKIIKAIISNNGNNPSKLHDLLRLISEALITNLQNDISKFLDDLNDIYFDTRYPLNHDELEDYIDSKKSEEVLKETKRIFSWLEKQIN